MWLLRLKDSFDWVDWLFGNPAGRRSLADKNSARPILYRIPVACVERSGAGAACILPHPSRLAGSETALFKPFVNSVQNSLPETAFILLRLLRQIPQSRFALGRPIAVAYVPVQQAALLRKARLSGWRKRRGSGGRRNAPIQGPAWIFDLVQVAQPGIAAQGLIDARRGQLFRTRLPLQSANWDTVVQRDQAIQENKVAYTGLEADFGSWTESSREVGTFRILAQASVRPRSRPGRRREAGRRGAVQKVVFWMISDRIQPAVRQFKYELYRFLYLGIMAGNKDGDAGLLRDFT